MVSFYSVCNVHIWSNRSVPGLRSDFTWFDICFCFVFSALFYTRCCCCCCFDLLYLSFLSPAWLMFVHTPVFPLCTYFSHVFLLASLCSMLVVSLCSCCVIKKTPVLIRNVSQVLFYCVLYIYFLNHDLQYTVRRLRTWCKNTTNKQTKINYV